MHGDGRGLPDGDVLDADGLEHDDGGRAEYQAPPRATTSATRCTATGSPSRALPWSPGRSRPVQQGDGDRVRARGRSTSPSRQARGEAVATASWIGRRSIRVRFGTLLQVGRCPLSVRTVVEDGVGLRRGAAGQVPTCQAGRLQGALRAAGTGRTESSETHSTQTPARRHDVDGSHACWWWTCDECEHPSTCCQAVSDVGRRPAHRPSCRASASGLGRREVAHEAPAHVGGGGPGDQRPVRSRGGAVARPAHPPRPRGREPPTRSATACSARRAGSPSGPTTATSRGPSRSASTTASAARRPAGSASRSRADPAARARPPPGAAATR